MTENSRNVNADNAHAVAPDARKAWKIWKSITDFSEWLWDQYEQEFMTLAASEPPPKRFSYDDNNLPF